MGELLLAHGCPIASRTSLLVLVLVLVLQWLRRAAPGWRPHERAASDAVEQTTHDALQWLFDRAAWPTPLDAAVVITPSSDRVVHQLMHCLCCVLWLMGSIVVIRPLLNKLLFFALASFLELRKTRKGGRHSLFHLTANSRKRQAKSSHFDRNRSSLMIH
jgi:hypothetical protein